MTERWERVKAVFAAVLSADSERQLRLLEELCADDPNLRDEVRALLGAHERRGFVDELAERLATVPGTHRRGRIGRYEIIEEIGRGGMGIVWKARDPQLDRVVALKLLPPLRGCDGEARQRLLIEARAAAALDHPAIATVYDIAETEDGEPFLAMAFYEGETLEACVARGAIPIAEAMRIGREVACGLAAAHARGITHRDLKPANILLCRSGSVKLLDFGIAKLAGVDQTQSGALVGTMAYMSPEQFRGEHVDPRTDVWAFGLVMYEMLIGERAVSDSRPAALRAVAGEHAAPPIGTRRRDVPRGLACVIERSLRSAPADRYRDGSELYAALQRLDDECVTEEVRTDAVSSKLPIPLTRFFGREREIDDITRLLQSGRLLTLTGPGGTGKTRLALQIASTLRSAFADGAAFVPLASIADPQLVPSEIGRVLEMPERPAVSALDALSSFLQRRRLLLLLDNFEHVVEAAPAVITLLAECADVRIVVTSRVPLKVSGEQEYAVSPLPHPAPDVPPPALDAYPATALFVDRARAVCSDFTVAGDQAAAIAEICARLDGLPLAIELAAARVKLFSPRAMLARLDRRFELLSAGGRDRPARHQSLRQAIAWSYDLLRPAEQALFRRLSVFVGGCSLEDAAAFSEALDPDARDVLEVCTALIDHSLVRRQDGPDGLPRLKMLSTIREFGLDRLQHAGEAQSTRRAHAERFLALAERAEPALTGPDQAAWFDRLEVEHDNFRVALLWAEGSGDVDVALRLGKALWRFWAARGHLREGRERLERLLAMPGADARPLLRAHVLHGAATLTHETSDFRRARALAEESLAIAREHGDRALVALVLNNVAWLRIWMGESADAEALCEEALALNRESVDARGIGVALQNRGSLAVFRGDCDHARALFEESLEWRRAGNDPRGTAYSMTYLAWVEIMRGALDRASRLLEDAQATFERLEDRQLLAWTLAIEGHLARAAGRTAEAIDRFERSIELWRDVGNVFGLAFSLVGDAEVAIDRGDRERASRNLDEALPLFRWAGECFGLADGLRVRARLAEDEGDRDSARAFYTESLELWARLGNRLAIRECHEALARNASPSR